MRTETKEYKVFAFNELTEKAKEKAANNLAEAFGWEFAWNSDYRKSLEAFEDAMNVEVYDWSVGAGEPFEYRFKPYDYNVKEINNGIRLATWINNNVLHKIDKGRFYSTNIKIVDGKYSYKHRYSHILEGDYMPTGYCADIYLFSNVVDCAKHLATFETFGDLVGACLDSFFSAWREDMEYQYSVEGAGELASCNNIEFLEDGSVYC